jgi:hypothetical protein
MTSPVFVVDPKPRRKVWLVCVKQTLHTILDGRRRVINPGVRGPVLSSVSSEWESLDIVTAIVELEENAETCLCKDRMRRLELNVIM